MAGQATQRAAAEIRRYQTIQLYVNGATERAIAQQLGVSPSLVHKDIKRVLKDLARDNEGAADEIRALQMQRYNQLLFSWFGIAKTSIEGLRSVLQIMKRIDEINGLIPDKPLINMELNQSMTIIGGNSEVEVMLHDDDIRAALDVIAQRMEGIPGGDSGEVVEGSMVSATASESDF
jgi:hypothetical protein